MSVAVLGSKGTEAAILPRQQPRLATSEGAGAVRQRTARFENTGSPAEVRETFTAAEIAAAIGWSKRKAQAALAGSLSAGTKFAGGKEATAWELTTLPENILAKLERVKVAHHYRSAGDVLRDPRKPWQPPVPLAKVSPAARREGELLREALAAALNMPKGTLIAARAVEAAPVHRRVFGKTVSPRHLERLIARTIERDRGASAWHRLELFLADASEKTRAFSPLPSSAFAELEEELSAISNHEKPTADDRSYCWRKVLEFYNSRCAAGAKAARLKRELRSFLLTAAPFLAESAQAMKRNFNRKLSDAAQDGIAAITDQRTTNSGRRHRPEDWQANIDLFAQWTLIRHGRESQAWRELHLGTTPTGDQFSQGFRDYYGFDVRTAKSRVPSSARDAIRAIIKATKAHQLGPRAARLARPSIPRDWSDTATGDYFTADDVTINHLWFEWHEFGEYEFEGQRFNAGRGQWLICCDERTDFPLGFLLMPSPLYNSAAICSLNARIFSDERLEATTTALQSASVTSWV